MSLTVSRCEAAKSRSLNAGSCFETGVSQPSACSSTRMPVSVAANAFDSDATRNTVSAFTGCGLRTSVTP